MRKTLAFMALIVIFAFGICIPTAEYQQSRDNGGEVLPKGAVISDPVFIDGDAELAAYPSKTGAGTRDNPYVIEYLEIVSDKAEASIRILNLYNSHLIIRNCRFTNTNDSTTIVGIYIIRCGNVTVQSNLFQNFQGFVVRAIAAYDSSNVTVIGNTIRDSEAYNTVVGITYQEYSDNGIISGNTIENLRANVGYSIGLEFWNGAVNNTITNNHVAHLFSGSTCYGIRVSKSNGSEMCDNVFQNLTSNVDCIGIDLSETGYSSITGNCFEDLTSVSSSSYGIRLSIKSQRNVLTGNLIHSGDIPAYDGDSGGTNQWSDCVYFAAMGRYQMVGNYYWNYTGLDENMDFIGDTPQKIYLANDNAPIMYGILDNDGDGVNNYREIHVLFTDPNDPDTDNDGIPDGQDANPLSADVSRLTIDPVLLSAFIAIIALGAVVILFGIWIGVISRRMNAISRSNLLVTSPPKNAR